MQPSVRNSLPSTLRDIGLSLRAFKGWLNTRISAVVDNNEHHPALLGAFTDRGAVYTLADLLRPTYSLNTRLIYD